MSQGCRKVVTRCRKTNCFEVLFHQISCQEAVLARPPRPDIHLSMRQRPVTVQMPCGARYVFKKTVLSLCRAIMQVVIISFEKSSMGRFLSFLLVHALSVLQSTRFLDFWTWALQSLFTSLRDGNRPHRIVGQPLVTANDVGHWDQKHPKVLIVGKKTRRIW